MGRNSENPDVENWENYLKAQDPKSCFEEKILSKKTQEKHFFL